MRPSPLALASPFGRRGDAKGDSEAVASHRASAVPRLVPCASPLGEATGATRRNESLRGFLRKFYNSLTRSQNSGSTEIAAAN
ncbi:MAG: hypothetical protein V7K21_16215 [Nostoc sp.]|uniref:hypothetical protein n=1 Tax=Nostoc sp. TaxID=1180 RepID=UPI002FFB4A5F